MTIILPALLQAIAARQPAPSTTFNPSTKGANITLSGGNLTASGTNNGSALSTTSKSNGKWYFEVTVIADPFPGNGYLYNGGLANSSFVTTGKLGLDVNNSVGLSDTDGVFVNGSSLGSYHSGASAVNDVIGIAVDIGGQLLWGINLTSGNKYWNANASYVPGDAHGYSFAAVSGPYFAGVSVGNSGGSAQTATINFGATSFTGSVPSGFSAWG